MSAQDEVFGPILPVLEIGSVDAVVDWVNARPWDVRKFVRQPELEMFGVQRMEFLDDVLVLRGAGVGGGSHVYGNTLYVPPKKFFDAPEWAGITESAAELAPCIDPASACAMTISLPRSQRRSRRRSYSFLEPNMVHAHNDYHPAFNAIVPGISADPPSSILSGEELLARIYTAIRASSTTEGSNFANTLSLVAFDEAGGTYDHVPSPAAPPPDPAAPEGQMGFRFDRSGIRIPTLAVSAYVEPRTVVTSEYRNTSLIRRLRERFSLGPPLTGRDAVAADIASILSRDTARAQEDWPEVTARSVPPMLDPLVRMDKPLPPLGKSLLATAIALDTLFTGHVPEIDPKTATTQQAHDYMVERQPRIWPGLSSR